MPLGIGNTLDIWRATENVASSGDVLTDSYSLSRSNVSARYHVVRQDRRLYYGGFDISAVLGFFRLYGDIPGEIFKDDILVDRDTLYQWLVLAEPTRSTALGGIKWKVLVQRLSTENAGIRGHYDA